MAKSLLQQAREWRELVLLVELGGWLHDLGKLSSRFVRQHLEPAYSTPGGESAPSPSPKEAKAPACQAKEKEKWEHEKVFTYDAHLLPPELAERLRRPLTGAKGWILRQEDRLESEGVTLQSLVEAHHRAEEKRKRLQWLLVYADGDDSGEDEYNAAELPQREPVHRATVFGKEEPLAGGVLEKLDQQREELYKSGQLAALFSIAQCPTVRRELWAILQYQLCHGLGKSQRAANDVRLDQHVWGVASRLKAFTLRELLDANFDPGRWPGHTFRLLTVWWNSWEAITPFARLSDVVGREAMLDELRDKLRRALEDDYAVGNRIYEDDDGVHFLMADLPWDLELTGLVRGIVNQVTGGEVQPVVCLSPATERVTDLVEQMRRARQELPLVGEPAWTKSWAGSPSHEVCPVCQRRPLEGERQLCPWCAERRHAGILRRLARKGTVWTGEIADANGRVALIVARFDLERWLDGTMLHTVFITSPQDILRGYYHWQAEECKRRCFKELARALAARSVPEVSWADLYEASRRLDAGMQQKTEWTANLQKLSDARKEYEESVEKKRHHSELIAAPGTHPQYKANLQKELEELEGKLARMRGEMRGLEECLKAPPTLEGALFHHFSRYEAKKKHAEQTASQLQKAYGLDTQEGLVLALVRKNPSASRLLRVWQTTEEFLKEQAQQLGELVQERQKAPRQRLVLTLSGHPELPSGIYKADVPGLGEVDLFVRPKEGDTVEAQTIVFSEDLVGDLVEQLKNRILSLPQDQRVLSLRKDERGRALVDEYRITNAVLETYAPYQVITVSPNLLLLMVPADLAMEVAERMQKAYAQEFGKVQGRLPFHVGLIFMDAHYPMFAALDAARRLAESFDHIAESEVEAELQSVQLQGDRYCLELKNDCFGAWRWEVPYQLGDGETDWYYPYFLVRAGTDLEGRHMSLRGPLSHAPQAPEPGAHAAAGDSSQGQAQEGQGRWVHVSELKRGDRVVFYPNSFDFLFLDTVSRRLEAQVLTKAPEGEAPRRAHALLGLPHSPRPYLLERVARLHEVWERICGMEGMSETRLEACTSLLARKWREWGMAQSGAPPHEEEYRWLAGQVVKRDLAGDEDIRCAVEDGTFFDAVELYRHILKRKVERPAHASPPRSTGEKSTEEG